MTNFGSAFGLLFCLSFVSFPCEGTITLPPRGDTFVVDPGTARVEVAWTFDDAIGVATVRLWKFLTTNEVLAIIVGNGNVVYGNTNLPNYEIVKPATLVLKNVDGRYNGTYEFSINTVTPKSSVTVFITEKTNVKTCSSPVSGNEGDIITCSCQGEGGNPPYPVNVTWIKNGDIIEDARRDINVLTLNNVSKSDIGMYTCRAETHPLSRNEKTIQVNVNLNYPPEKPTLTFSLNPAIVGESLEIKCEAKALPVPSYTITHNGAKIISNHSTYSIEKVEYSDGGSYKCVTENKLGMNSVTDDLKAVGLIQPTTIMPSSNACDNVERRGVVVWHILLSLISGIIIGTLLLYTVQYYRCRFRNRKPQSNPQPETSKVNSIYQGLDLSKMNSEDNYQSLRVNSGTSDADYENDSTYTELNKVRDVENNYQSLT